MNLDKDSSKNKDTQPGGIQPSKALYAFLDQEVHNTEDLRKNLGTDYDKSTFEKIERNLTDMRNTLKGKLKNIADPDQEYMNRSEIRKNFAEDAIQKYTKAAENFQEARENNKLNRPKVTDAIEDLSYALKNLKHLIDRPDKK